MKLLDFLPYRFTLLSNAATAIFSESYRTYKISAPEWRTIMLLAEFPDISADRLSELSRIEKSVVSRLVSDLLRRQLITRETDENDRRVSVLTLSPRGEEVYRKVLPEARRFNARLLGSIDEGDRAALMRILDRLSQVVADAEKEAEK